MLHDKTFDLQCVEKFIHSNSIAKYRGYHLKNYRWRHGQNSNDVNKAIRTSKDANLITKVDVSEGFSEKNEFIPYIIYIHTV